MSTQYIITASGKEFDFFNPGMDDIVLDDIAWSLSQICRFTGHTGSFYSVARHSIIVSHMLGRENALWGLMHDAAEAYIGDISTPLKRNLHFKMGDAVWLMEDYEMQLLKLIAKKFNLPWPIPEAVFMVDRKILEWELRRMNTNMGLPFYGTPEGDYHEFLILYELLNEV